jgi:cellulose synthase (UDP-forming)
MLLGALGALLERRQRRSTPRMPALLNATLLIDEVELACRVTDLSLGGCRMVFKGVSERTFHKLGRTQLRITIDDEQPDRLLNLHLRNLRLDDHSGEITVGAEFAHLSLEETRAKMRLVSGSRERWVEFQKRRESRLGVLGCFISFAYIGLTNSALHLIHLVTHAGDSVTGRGRVLETQSFEN